MMRNVVRIASVAGLAVGLGGCWGQLYEPPGIQYFQRTDTITLGAGDAKDANAAINVIDPWAPHSANVRIPGQGERMVNAIEQYNKSRPPATGVQQSGSTSSQPPSGPAAAPAANGGSSSTLPF